MKFWILACFVGVSACSTPEKKATNVELLPKSAFVSLEAVDPSIVVEMRYFTRHNFVGRPIKGYHANRCFLTKETADALARVQAELKTLLLSLKGYDCYRPQEAVNDFMEWSKDASDTRTQKEFYPHVDKKDVFKLGYVASKSGHSRGSTVDLTLIPFPPPKQAGYQEGQSLFECYLPVGKRFHDNSIDMGTGYDCFDERAATASALVSKRAQKNRSLLKNLMEKYGFKNYEAEWWHYTLKNEPFADTYFNFPVE